MPEIHTRRILLRDSIGCLGNSNAPMTIELLVERQQYQHRIASLRIALRAARNDCQLSIDAVRKAGKRRAYIVQLQIGSDGLADGLPPDLLLSLEHDEPDDLTHVLPNDQA